MDAKFEVIGMWPGTQEVTLPQLLEGLGEQDFADMVPGDSLVIKRIS